MGLIGGAAAGCTGTAGASPEAKDKASSSSAAPEKSGKPSPTKSGKPSSPSAKPGPDKPKPKILMAVGSKSKQVRELQARLRGIGHFDRSPTGYYGSMTAGAVSSFQGKRGLAKTGRTDTVTWARLVGMTKKPDRDALYPPTTNSLDKPDKRCLTGRVLCISKTSDTLRWMVDGKVVEAMDVRFGSQYTPTREGTFKVFQKSRYWTSTIYHTQMPYAMFFSGGQAVHYSSDFAARGYAGASHGCVNVRDEAKLSAVFAQVKNGDRVVVYR
ncbi:L,D-transpeptidase family protein [Streptomyces boninensis]|uniref:L,D-transpeptidase family protein n=1 Tax=Streptomyces boninensis TaxID=2039455 RepID=UPI003B21CEDF